MERVNYRCKSKKLQVLSCSCKNAEDMIYLKRGKTCLTLSRVSSFLIFTPPPFYYS